MSRSRLRREAAQRGEPQPSFEFGGDTLTDARARLRQEVREGVVCPCCDRLAKAYRRKVTGNMAKFLIWLVRSYERDPKWYNRAEAPVMNHISGGPDYGKLRYWDLVTPCPNLAEFPAEYNPRLPARRSGWWRPTSTGIHFARHNLALPKYAIVWHDTVLGYEGEDVLISECLPEYFDFWEAWGCDE